MRKNHPLKVWGASKDTPLNAKKKAAEAARKAYKDAQKIRKEKEAARRRKFLSEEDLQDTYEELIGGHPDLTRITREEAKQAESDRKSVLSKSYKQKLKKQQAKRGSFPSKISLPSSNGPSMLRATILSPWEVSTILEKAISICLNAYYELSKGGGYYENVMMSKKLTANEKDYTIELARKKTEKLRDELQASISSQGEYKVAYRIESVASEFYRMEEYYIYVSYEEIEGKAWYFLFTTLYKQITGDDLPLELDQELTIYKGQADTYLDEMEQIDFI